MVKFRPISDQMSSEIKTKIDYFMANSDSRFLKSKPYSTLGYDSKKGKVKSPGKRKGHIRASKAGFL